MKQKATVFFACAIILAIIGIIFLCVGFDKITSYENSEYSWEKNKNAYVGGNAYNYIINGTYFAGYSALSGAMFICACICAGQAVKAKSDDELLEATKEMNRTLKIGYAGDLEQEKEKEAEAERVRAAQAEWESQQREEAEAAKQARIAAYWEKHQEEKKALGEKYAVAVKKLQEGGLAKEQREVLEKLIRDIEAEFEKDREEE